MFPVSYYYRKVGAPWQKEYAAEFVDGVAAREAESGVRLAVENMFPWRARGRDLQAYLPHWDPVPMSYDHVTLDLSHTATAGSDALAMASRVPALYDEPFADPSAIPTALLCAAAPSAHADRFRVGMLQCDSTPRVGLVLGSAQSLRCVRPGGTLSMIGILSGSAMTASLGSIITRQVRLQDRESVV